MRPIDIKILADAAKAKREINGLADTTDKSSSRIGSSLKTAAKVGALALAGGAVIAGKALFDMAKGAAADEAAQARLANTLKNATGANAKQVAGVEKYIAKQGQLLGVTDDELRPALARLSTATGDIGKAQKLSSLAMDVSAGSGKSLEQVSTALMKAQNGQVSSLSRLGINTKNAAGETISMEQATKRMGDLFGGAASTQAGTLEGQMGRLRVRYDEAKEAIGARLLPVLTQGAAVLMDKVAPAFEQGAQKAVMLGREIAEKAAPFIKKISDILTQSVIPIMSQWASFITGTVIPAVTKTAGKIATALKPAIDEAAKVVAKIAEKFREWQPTIEKAAGLILKITLKVAEFAAIILGKVLPPVIKFAGFLTGLLIDAVGSAIKIIIRIGEDVASTGQSIAAAGEKAREFAAKIREKFGDAVEFVKGIPAKIKNALGDLGNNLTQAGRDIISGLINGLREKAAELGAAVKSYIIDKLPGPVRKAMGIASPSKVFRQIGAYLMQGLAQGIEQTSGLVDRTLAKTNAAIKAQLDKRYDGKALTKHTEKALKSIADESKALQNMSAKWDDLKAKIADARQAIKDYSDAMRDSIVETGNITALGKRTVTTTDADGNETSTETVTLAAIIEDAEKAAADAERYRLLIADLTGRGLNDTTLKQLLAAGVEGGLATAEAIAAGGADSIAKLNSVTAQLTTTGAALGADMAQKFALLGGQAAAGLLEGFLADEAKIEKAAQGLTDALVKAVKKALKIKSPSRVFAEIGAFTAGGLVIGLDDARVARAGRNMAKDLVTGFGRPGLDARLLRDARPLLAQASTPFDVTGRLTLTAPEIDALTRGREVQADLDVYRRAGGRVTA